MRWAYNDECNGTEASVAILRPGPLHSIEDCEPMSERSAYSRVYWSIVDDPKFESIYDDDRHLAAWLRLLLIADQAHPASAHLPANVRKASVTALEAAGLVDVTGGRYRIRGLDAERKRRSEPARASAVARWSQTGGNANGVRTHTERNANGVLDETRTRRDETNAPANDPYADDEGEALTWLAKHGCDVRPGNGYHRQLVTAVQAHGINSVIGMFDRLAAAGMKAGDTKGYVFGMLDALNSRTRPDLAVLEAEERQASFAERAARTRERNADIAAAIEGKSS